MLRNAVWNLGAGAPCVQSAAALGFALGALCSIACSDQTVNNERSARDAGPNGTSDGALKGTDGSSGGSDSGATEGGKPVSVTINDGQLAGETDGAARRFLGIPYAKPPVGDLRWKAPVKNDPWTGPRDATKFGKRCAQAKTLLGDASTDEDCLTLNVWAPDPPPSKPVPVMFWLHGGAYISGSTADQIPFGIGGVLYNGRAFAEKNLVVVTANYRLGVFGFFSHPALTTEGSPSGNQGLLDQRLALTWVRDNIEKFGGDPKNVTLFGESAGAMATCFHMASPGSQGLFHRAISESGGCTTFVEPVADAENDFASFASHAGCAGTDELTCLRNKSVPDLMFDAPEIPKVVAGLDGGKPNSGAPNTDAGDGGTAKLPGQDDYHDYGSTTPAWHFRPVVDGVVVPDQPRKLFDAGTISKVPYILGSNTDEGTLFHFGATPVANEAEYLAALTRQFGSRASEVLAQYPVANFPTAEAALERVTGDWLLVCSTHDSARRAAAAGLPVYMYNFDVPVVVPGLQALGAMHGLETQFVFASRSNWPDASRKDVSDQMQGYWSRFAVAGDPNGGSAMTWPKFTTTSDQRMQFNPTQQSVVTDFRVHECAFWATFYDAEFK